MVTITRALFVWSFIVIVIQRVGEQLVKQETLLDHMLKYKTQNQKKQIHISL